MRALLILAAAMLFGLAGGYAWSAMAHKTRATAHLPRPKIDATLVATPGPSELDKEWAARADDKPAREAGSAQDRGSVEQGVHYSGCNEVRAAGAAPLYAGQPGYRTGLDGDGDGIACEPYRGS